MIDAAPSTAVLEHWLNMNGIKPVVTEVLDSIDPPIKADKVQRLMNTVGVNDWYIDIDPDTIAHTLRMGIPSLLVAYPYVPRPEWSLNPPPIKSWDALVQEVDSQALVRADRGTNWDEEA